MKSWDSSALVPLCAQQAATTALRTVARDDPAIVVWWTTAVECASTLARLEREGALSSEAVSDAFRQLDVLARAWREVEPVGEIRDVARRLLRVHSLRAAAALQLAAADMAAERRPPTLEIVTLDDRIRQAALKEGFALAAIQPR